MKKDVNGAIMFKHYGVDKLIYEINPLSVKGQIFLNEENFKLKRKVNATSEIGELVIQVELFERNSIKYPFYLSFIIYGLFGNNNLSESDFYKAVEFNGTAILFPFIRSTIADVTRIANNGNVVLLPTINVNTFFDK